MVTGALGTQIFGFKKWSAILWISGRVKMDTKLCSSEGGERQLNAHPKFMMAEVYMYIVTEHYFLVAKATLESHMSMCLSVTKSLPLSCLSAIYQPITNYSNHPSCNPPLSLSES